MGLIGRRPILPAPTDSLIESADDTGLETDLGTELSRRTDKTSETIPDDGSPITIITAPKKRSTIGKSKAGQQSQTSLLIEYFEGSKTSESGQRRPSLRVRYTPSHSKKSKEPAGEGHILVTESPTARRPSQRHRIALGGNETLKHQILEGSISSLGSGNDIARPPIEIDVQEGSDISGLSASPEARYIIPESDISSMPAESSLGPTQPIIMGHTGYNESGSRSVIAESSGLKPPVVPNERNASNERLTQKVIEKLSNRPRVSASGKRALTAQSGSRSSVSREVEQTYPSESRVRAAKNIDDESIPSATGSSLVSGSMLSAEPAKLHDERSVRSGTSNVSITNNPKLLQTVEDAIKRLILPELNEIRRDQRHQSHRSKYDKLSELSDVSSSTVSREERTHRKSSGGKSGRRVSGGSDHAHTSSRRRRREKSAEYESQSEQSYEPSESLDSNSIREEKRRSHKKSHRIRDVAAGALGGAALTAAALKSHDSGSSLEHSERRRRRRSKSRSSRSASINEQQDEFTKHHVPPMPFVSEIGTDLTRSSLQSSKDGGALTPTRHEVREVIRGSPMDLTPPSLTPNRHSTDLRQGLGTHHGNFSERDLSGHDISTRKEVYDDDDESDVRRSEELDFATHGFAALAGPELAKAYERNLHQQHPIRRGLSPIQSVASYATTEPNRASMHIARSLESMESEKKQHNIDDQASVSSLSSEPAANFAQSRRPHGISLENRSEIMAQHADSTDTTPRQAATRDIFDEEHLQNEAYRDSPYIDKVTSGHQVATAAVVNPEYMNTPSGVESVVASLVEPSVLDMNPSQHSLGESLSERSLRSSHHSQYGYGSVPGDSPLRERISNRSQHENYAIPAVLGATAAAAAAGAALRSPQQSPARSAEHLRQQSAKSLPRAVHVTDELKATPLDRSPNSDITTNPSVIQGPIGGLSQGNTEHWPYDPTPPHSHTDLRLPLVSRDIGSAGGASLIPEPLSTNRDHDIEGKRDLYSRSQHAATPTALGDEGYETGANARSPGLYSQDHGNREDTFTPDAALGNDPFTTTRENYASGLSHGMSPMYDGTTGRGRENIQSKDIVALMDHLTTRDAQRNARDTEILVTLVRTAAEMRNNFEDMKKFIQEQDDMIMDTADRQHEKTQKAINGPRPQPSTPNRAVLSGISEDDLPAKRRNVFQRALRGLSSKNSQDIQNIETMLVRLLEEVAALRAVQANPEVAEQPRYTSLTSNDAARAPTDTGYEPEGQAGTSSTGDRSGFFSNNSSRQTDYRTYGAHRDSGNRVSTVMEGDEEYDDYDASLGVAREVNLGSADRTPRAPSPVDGGNRQIRGGSVPLNTPPRPHNQNLGSLSNENTPHLSTEGSSKKHKSFASSFIPKMVSRWSKTTASSDNFRSSGPQVARPYSSQSNEYEYEHQDHEDDDYEDENRPPSPLIPSQVSENHPKYQAHRNSLNLQHPQPRQGPTGRYQSRLESEAQNYYDQVSPTSHSSSQWENQSSLHPANPAHSGVQDSHLPPIAEPGYSMEQGMHYDGGSVRSGTSSQGPPRPPKILNDDPLVPQRPPKVLMSPPPSNRQPTYVDHVAAARAGSPAFDRTPVSALRSPQSATRKPSGPRPLASGGSKGDLNAVKRTRFRGSPNQIDSDDEAGQGY